MLEYISNNHQLLRNCGFIFLIIGSILSMIGHANLSLEERANNKNRNTAWLVASIVAAGLAAYHLLAFIKINETVLYIMLSLIFIFTLVSIRRVYTSTYISGVKIVYILSDVFKYFSASLLLVGIVGSK